MRVKRGCMLALLIAVTLASPFLVSCGGGTQQDWGGGLEPEDPVEAVSEYLRRMDRGEYPSALALLEDPGSPVWPGGTALAKAGEEKVGDGLDLDSLQLGEAWTPQEASGQFFCLVSCGMRPGPAGDPFGVSGRDGRFLFIVLQREGRWRINRGVLVSQQIFDYLAGKPIPFRNCSAKFPGELKRGDSYRVSFDLHLPKSLSWVEEVSFIMAPEPGTSGYPRVFETAFSTYWYDVGGVRKPVEHFDQEVEVDEEASPGYYRLYLALGTNPQILWPLFPFTVKVE